MRMILQSLMVAGGLASVLYCQTARADLITNGNFDSGATGWTLNTRATGNVVEVIAAAQSPITSTSASSGLHMSEASSVSLPPLAKQDLSSLQTGGLSITFDVCVTSATTYTGTDGAFIFRLFDDAGHSVGLSFRGNGTLNDSASTPYTKGQWYTVQLTIPAISTLTASSQATVVLTPQGGTSTTTSIAWTNGSGSFSTPNASYKTVQVQNAFGTWTNGTTADFYFDNLTVAPVPEPAALGMLGSAFLVLGLRR